MGILLAAALTLALVLTGPREDAGASAQAELQRFQGVWELVSAQAGDRVQPLDPARPVRVTIRGNRHTVRVGDMTVAADVLFTLDPQARPAGVEDSLPDGRRIRGIYELQGDSLRSCVATVDRPRPTAFCTAEGDTPTLRVFRRVAP